MKKALLVASVLALAAVGTAGAQRSSQYSTVDDTRAAAMKAFCSHGEKCAPALTTEQAQQAQATVAAHDELHLRQMGMPPETARNAIWAMRHKPQSQCAVFATSLVGDYNIAETSPDMADPASDNDTIVKIEQSGICERGNIK